jgi:NADPH-ferrihemoprotein reductase
MRKPELAKKLDLLGKVSWNLPDVRLNVLMVFRFRFETREIAEKILAQFHNVPGKDGVKLLLRFADTKAQKQLKYQSNERRAYRAGEYTFSVEMVQGSSPSPTLHRLQQAASHFSPTSQASFPSPLGVGPVWTPATSISPS